MSLPSEHVERLIYSSAAALLSDQNALVADLHQQILRGPARSTHFVLEVGCGSGLLSASLAMHEPNWVYYLGDVDQAVLPLAGRLASTISAVLGDRLNLMLGRLDVFNLQAFFDPHSLDICFSEGMMNLFDSERQLLALKKQLDVADTVISFMPNAAAPVIAAKYADSRNRPIWGHPTLPDEVVARWRLGLNNQQVDIEPVFFLKGDPARDHQFAVVARWKEPRRLPSSPKP